MLKNLTKRQELGYFMYKMRLFEEAWEKMSRLYFCLLWNGQICYLRLTEKLRSEECPLKSFLLIPWRITLTPTFPLMACWFVSWCTTTFEVAFVYSSTNGPKVLASPPSHKRDTDLWALESTFADRHATT